MSASSAVKEYRARVDSKKRLTLRGAATGDFRVQHRKDGSILLKPLIIDPPQPISAQTLKAMDTAIGNLKAGKRSTPADLRKYGRFAK